MSEIPRMASLALASNSYGLGDNALWADRIDAAVMGAKRRIVEPQHHQHQEPKMADANRRIVKVYIVDTDENVPVEKCLLLETDARLTEATDQELFFECDIKSIMDKHNAYRVTLIDKKVKEREQKLEPVRIRDLKMTVVTLAAF